MYGNRALRAGAGLLTGYGLSNILGGLYPLTLDEKSAVPMHILATNIQLALMISAMCFMATGFHGLMRAYSLASMGTPMVMGMVPSRPSPVQTPCSESARERASEHSFSGSWFSP